MKRVVTHQSGKGGGNVVRHCRFGGRSWFQRSFESGGDWCIPEFVAEKCKRPFAGFLLISAFLRASRGKANQCQTSVRMVTHQSPVETLSEMFHAGQRTKNNPKGEFAGRMSRGRLGVIRADIRNQENGVLARGLSSKNALLFRLWLSECQKHCLVISLLSGKKKAHKLFALVNVQMALGQTAACPRVNRAKKFMCSPRNTGNINFSLWLIGVLSQGCPAFKKFMCSQLMCLFLALVKVTSQIVSEIKCSDFRAHGTLNYAK